MYLDFRRPVRAAEQEPGQRQDDAECERRKQRLLLEETIGQDAEEAERNRAEYAASRLRVERPGFSRDPELQRQQQRAGDPHLVEQNADRALNREAISQTLVELGYLYHTRRSIALPITTKKAASIT